MSEQLRPCPICCGTGTVSVPAPEPTPTYYCDNCEWDEGDGELFQCPSCIARQYDADEGAVLTEEK
jgi:hypothetical protein